MEPYFKFTLGTALVLLGATACHKTANNNPVQNVQEAAADKDLQSKIFRGDCSVKLAEAIGSAIATEGKFMIKSAREQYQFVGANFTHATLMYETANCSGQEALVFKESGAFHVNAKNRAEDQSKSIDLKFDRLTLTAVSEIGANVARDTKICGHEDWAAGKGHDVTEHSGDLTCYHKVLPAQEANVYRLDSNKLYFGSRGPLMNAETRPTKADMSVKYSAE